MGAARALKELFGTPYVVGVPMGQAFSQRLAAGLDAAASTGENQFPVSDLPSGDILLIGEAVTSLSLASALELETGRGVRVLCPTEVLGLPLREKDLAHQYEEDIAAAMTSAKLVIADPLFRPICPEDVRFLELPAESFSGRLFRQRIPNLISDFSAFLQEVV